MFAGPQCNLLPDGRRLHLNHGPIDLIVEAFGSQSVIDAAYEQAIARFSNVLNGLVRELKNLRQPVCAPRWVPDDPVARRMMDSCWPHRGEFVTPMAAVAGAVADEVLAALVEGRDLERAYVNNGGDIAFYLTPGATLTAGLVGDYHMPSLNASCTLNYDPPIRGIATSGWKGRSYSLGIADSVTVLAETGAAADAAATLIANQVYADDPAIERTPAGDLDPDSDLGDRPVTIAVGPLDDDTVAAALNSGVTTAKIMQRAGLVTGAVLVLQQQFRTIGTVPAGLIQEQAA